MGFVVPVAPEGSTGKLVFVVVFGEAQDRTCDRWFTRRVIYPLHHGGFLLFFTMLLHVEVHTSFYTLLVDVHVSRGRF